MASTTTSMLPSPLAADSRQRRLQMRRRYQGGHLFQEGKRVVLWKCRYAADEIMADGTVKRRLKKHVLGSLAELPTKRLAQRAMADFIATINSASYKPKNLTTFGDFAAKWKLMVMPNHKPSSQVFETTTIRMLERDFASVALSDIDTEFLQRWLAGKTAYAPKSIRNIISVLRMMWKSAKAWGYVEGDPFEGLVLPKKGLASKPMIAPAHAREIIERAAEPWRTMFWIVAETGMRGGEVCGLEEQDFKGDALAIRQSAWLGTVQTPKTPNAVRLCPISPQLSTHIERFLASKKVVTLGGESRRFMFDGGGKPMNNYAIVQNVLRPLLIEMGIYQPRMGLHSFRRGSCSAMDSLGTPASVRMQRVGHAAFSTTMGYTQAFSEDHLAAARKLGEMYAPAVAAAGD